MRVKNMAWTFDKAFSKETCDKIIEHGLAQKSMKAKLVLVMLALIEIQK